MCHFTVQIAANTYFESVKNKNNNNNKSVCEQSVLIVENLMIIEISECISRLDITDKGIK